MNRVLLTVGCGALACLCVFGAASLAAQAATFFDDLAAANGDVETVSGDRWLAGSFTTDAATYDSLTATLLLAESSAGTAQLDLYADGGLQPDGLVGSFTSPASYSASLSDAAFTLSGVSLTADTTYWLVLHATSGAFDWGWTSDFSVTNDWGDSDDAGANWFTVDVYPLQYSVASGAIPEPATAALAAAAFAVAGRLVRRRR